MSAVFHTIDRAEQTAKLQNAEVVICAGGAVETARLLLELGLAPIPARLGQSA